jgi:uncharacterized Zn finger protein
MAPAVRLLTHEPDQVTAEVDGRGQRNFFVDWSPRWTGQWFCTCTHGPDCSHVRAVKAHTERSTT